MKSLLIPAAVIAVLAVVLAACGGDGTKENGSITPEATLVPQPTETSQPTPTPPQAPPPSPPALASATPIAASPLPTPASLTTWTSGWPKGQATDEITALAIDPANETVVYASTPAALYRSTDGGLSWSTVRPLPNVVLLEVAPGTHDLYGYFWPALNGTSQSARGFMRSSDGGKSWSDPSNGASAELIGPATTMAVDPSNPSTILVGTAYYGRYGQILRSIDGGATWQVTHTIDSVMGAGDITAIAIHPKNGNIIYAAQTVYHGGGVLRSDDGGLSWRHLAPAGMPLWFPASIALDPANADVAHVAWQALMGLGVNVYRTEDGGGTWLKASSGLPETPGFGPHLAIDPLDPNLLFLSVQGDDAGGVYRSTDGGDSWERTSPEGAPQFAHVSALAHDPDEHELYVGTNEGVWQTGTLY